jgi:hypothetical protein
MTQLRGNHTGSQGADGIFISETGGTGGAGYTIANLRLTVDNYGVIAGGIGGKGGPGDYQPADIRYHVFYPPSTSPGGSGGSGGVGVDLSAGDLFNRAGGSIRGGTGGGGNYTPTYDGFPGGSGGIGGVGVESTSTRTVYNDVGAVITGGNGGNGGTTGPYSFFDPAVGGNGGVGVDLSAGTLDNYGTISGGQGGVGYHDGYGGTGGAGVSLNGGRALNLGTISGGSGGASAYTYFFGGSGGSGGAGVLLNGGAFTTSGTISGGMGGVGGVGDEAIQGPAGDAVQFGSVASTLIVAPGAIFNGQVVANAVVNDTLELTGTESVGTGITLGSQFTGFETLDFAAGAQWTVDLGAGAATSHTLTIYGFVTGETLDITNQTATQVAGDFGAGATAMSEGAGVLAFKGGNNPQFTSSADGTATFNSNFSAEYFILTPDTHGGTDVTVADAACFRRGTRIRTSRGEVPIEQLGVGDEVITMSGARKAVRWLGSRRIDCRRHPHPTHVWPIRIKAGALAPQTPERDLWVSPGHSLYLEGVLIQAENLVNGATIEQVPEARVEYWHVELDEHDVLLADGAPAESYLDTGNRTAFSNGGAFIEAHPDFMPKHWSATCVPLIMEGELLMRARAGVRDRAQALGYRITAQAAVHLIADGEQSSR